MKILSSDLLRYFPSLHFPVQVLSVKGDHVAVLADESTLRELIHSGSVMGVGSWKRLKRIRFISSETEETEERERVEENVFVSRAMSPASYLGTRYSFPQRLPSGHTTWAFKHLSSAHRACLNGSIRSVMVRPAAKGGN